MRRFVVHSLVFLDRCVIAPAPVILAAVSGYYLFFVITPFFLLGISKVPYIKLLSGEVSLEKALGAPAAITAFVLEMIMWLMTYVWVCSLVNFARTRKWWVLAAIVLAPLPLAYFNAGPYADEMKEWVMSL